MSTMASGPYDWQAEEVPDASGARVPGSRGGSAGERARVRRARAVSAQAPRQVPVDSSGPGAEQLHGGPAGSGVGASRVTRTASAAGAFVGGVAGAAAGSFVPPVTVNYTRNGGNGDGGNGGGGGAGPADGGAADRHQGDRMIYAIERIEIRSDKDILALAKAINHLGRELHLILGMRAEEINGVLSTYKGKWYHFGTSSRVKARLVSAHLKVSAEAAKALGVGALKMAAAFDRHFVKPEQEAKRARSGKAAPKKTFTIGES
ncbi:hypothetical protein [Streptomyces sp. NPDC051567]|uniref:hypothetical protein n=1 Tax=Streptomyces sp. NPDC051567 TaxID=3365660 RepID=UPI0037A1E7EE